MFFYLLIAAISILVALARGGSFRAIPTIHRLWLPPLSAALQLVTELFPASPVAPIFIVAGYAVLLGFVHANWQFLGLRLLTLGLALNLLVSLVNGGQMPTSVEAARFVGVPQQYIVQLEADRMPKHTPMSDQSHLAFLGDIIPIKYPLARVLSFGDLFVIFGVFLLVQDSMGKRLSLFGPGERT